MPNPAANPNPTPTPAPTSAALAAARRALQDILQAPPPDPESILQSLRHLNPVAGRLVLLELLQAGEFTDGIQAFFPIFAEAFDFKLSPELEKMLFANYQASTMGTMFEEPEAPLMLADAMVHYAGPHDALALENLEQERRAFMVPAWIIYGPALKRKELAHLHPFMVKAITSEAVRANLDIWDDILRLEPAEPARSLLHESLMKHRTVSMGGRSLAELGLQAAEPLAAPVRAFFSECDGTGTYTILVQVLLPNGNVHVHNVARRMDGEPRDGFSLGNREAGNLDSMQEGGFSLEDLAFTPLPLAEAAVWARRTLDWKNADQETRYAAASLIWSIGMGQPWGDEPEVRSLDEEVPSVPEPCDEEMHEFFMDFHLSWFLDAEQMRHLGIEPGDLRTADAKAQEAAFELFDNPKVRKNLQDMLRHMSLYRRYAGTDGGHVPGPGFYERLMRMLDDKEKGRLFLQHYFINCMAAFLAKPESIIFPIGDTRRRQRLREVGFPRLTRPKGKHMAYLDFAEVAHHALESITNFKGAEYPMDLAGGPADGVLRRCLRRVRGALSVAADGWAEEAVFRGRAPQQKRKP